MINLDKLKLFNFTLKQIKDMYIPIPIKENIV